MKQINSYLSFNGNCREAMNFYKQCLGGELTLQTVGESPLAGSMPPQMKESILHSTLVKDQMVLMATDMVGESGLIKGNSVSLCLNCSSEDEVRATYEALATGGEKTHPLQDMFWGGLFGDLKDRYGNIWILHFDRNASKN